VGVDVLRPCSLDLKTDNRHAGFGFLTTVTMNRVIYGAVAPCSRVEVHGRFGEKFCPDLQT
jgi:hypothetical protein